MPSGDHYSPSVSAGIIPGASIETPQIGAYKKSSSRLTIVFHWILGRNRRVESDLELEEFRLALLIGGLVTATLNGRRT